jgi:probable F420-dependent oxidoreductase
MAGPPTRQHRLSWTRTKTSEVVSFVSMSLSVGIGLFTAQVPGGSARTFEREYADTIELVRQAESAGFDSAWVSEHHGSSDGYMPSLFVMLGALAAATTTIRLGTGVVLAPLHDPIRLAEDAAVVDQLSSGRLTVGLGIGWREEEFRMFGIPVHERLPRLIDTVEILRRAWTGERFSYAGAVLRYEAVRVTPPAAVRGGPPILLGGYVDAAVRRSGQLADGHITDSVDDPTRLGEIVALMDEGARAAGKDPRRLGLTLLQNVFVHEDADRAWEVVRDGVAHQHGVYESWADGHDTPGHDSLEPLLADPFSTRAGAIVGDPDVVAKALLPVVRAHADRHLELVVRLHYPGMDFGSAAPAIELFATRVIPRLRAVASARG